MAQLTIYLPDGVEKAIRREARRARKSLSSYLTDLARREVEHSRWPADFSRLYGSWQGEFPEIPDVPPEGIDRL